jgi:hypothetical protein
VIASGILPIGWFKVLLLESTQPHTPQPLPMPTAIYMPQALNDDNVWAISKSFSCYFLVSITIDCFVGFKILSTPGNETKGFGNKRGPK